MVERCDVGRLPFLIFLLGRFFFDDYSAFIIIFLFLKIPQNQFGDKKMDLHINECKGFCKILSLPFKSRKLISKIKTMKSILIAFLFVTTISFSQNDVKEQYKSFQQEFEAYRTNPEVSSENSNLKPGPCGQYSLKYMVTGQGSKEVISVPPARKLCFDMNKFDKSKNPNSSPDWEYEIKPIGDRYYTIRASKKGAEDKLEVYYYERKK